MDLDYVVSKKGDFAAKQVGEELVLVPVKDNVAEMNEMFTLNDVGTFIWEKLEPKVTLIALTNSLTEEFEIDQKVAEDDLNEFLGELEKMMNG